MAGIPADVIGKMADRAEEMLSAYARDTMRVTVRERIKRLLGRPVREKDVLFWPAGMLMLGLAEAGRTDPARIAPVRDYLGAWEDGGGRVLLTDDALTGYAALAAEETAASGDTDVFARTADRVRRFLADAPRDKEGAFIYNPARGGDRVFADGAGMTALMLSGYARLRAGTDGAYRAAQEAERQVLLFLQYGWDTESGLPWHAYSLSEDRTLPIAGWGRAVGWLMMGMAGVLCVSEAPEVRRAFDALARRVLAAQQPSGLLGWKLAGIPDESADGEAVHTDTSCSGMALWALLTGGYDPSDPRITALVRGLAASVNGEGEVTGSLAECLDVGVYPQRFGVFPWGQGAALAALSRWTRAKEERTI